jgi:YD repeat-containing protein
MTENDAVASNTYTYSYDAFNRLTQAGITSGTGTSYTYSYDSNGNMTRKIAGSSTTSYAFNAADELCWAYSGSSSNSCSSAPTGATTYTYDFNGNETGNSTGGLFSYNPKNQTTAITFGGTTLSPLIYSGTDQTQRTGAGSTATRQRAIRGSAVDQWRH